MLQLQRAGSTRENPFQRAGSGRTSSERKNPFSSPKASGGSKGRKEGSGKNSGSGKTGSGRKIGEQLKARRLLLEPGIGNITALLSPAEEDEWQKILGDPDTADPSLSPAHAILIDMECLAMLNKLPETVDSLSADLQKQLFSILTRTTQLLVESGRYPVGDQRLLPQLFAAVVAQLQRVVEAHRLAATASQRATGRHQCEVARLEQGAVWGKVQAVMQVLFCFVFFVRCRLLCRCCSQDDMSYFVISCHILSYIIISCHIFSYLIISFQVLLTDYLDFKSSSTLGSMSTSQQNPTTYSEPTADINSYFVRRKTARTKKSQLFRFDSSSTALSMNDYLREHTEETGETGKEEKVLVCDANPHNITLIFSQLMQFIQEIEKALKCQPGTHCTLYAFLMDYIKDVFLGQIHVDISNSLNSASQSLDAWKSVVDSDELRKLAVSRPLLASTVSVKASIDNLAEMMVTLPLYSHHFLTIMCNVLMQYKEICGAAYRGLVQPDAEDKRIISAQWAKDEDISRFLKSLPNWTTVSVASEVEETAEEVERRNTKEVRSR